MARARARVRASARARAWASVRAKTRARARAKTMARARARAVRTDELLKSRQGFGCHRGVQRRVEGGCSVVFSLCFLYDRMQSTSLTDMAGRIPT
jgi:hypothetical protein